MRTASNSLRRVFGGVSLAILGTIHLAAAQDLSNADIIKLLTRTSAQPDERALFIDALRNKPSHLFSPSEREKLNGLAKDKPYVDLVMEFDDGSARLVGPALANAKKLGEALLSSSLKDQTFMVAGHTDAKGSDATNQKLSERRAEAVKQFLVQTYGIPASNLIAVGYSSMHLRNADDPNSRQNRRVQIVNVLQSGH